MANAGPQGSAADSGAVTTPPAAPTAVHPARTTTTTAPTTPSDKAQANVDYVDIEKVPTTGKEASVADETESDTDVDDDHGGIRLRDLSGHENVQFPGLKREHWW